MFIDKILAETKTPPVECAILYENHNLIVLQPHNEGAALALGAWYYNKNMYIIETPVSAHMFVPSPEEEQSYLTHISGDYKIPDEYINIIITIPEMRVQFIAMLLYEFASSKDKCAYRIKEILQQVPTEILSQVLCSPMCMLDCSAHFETIQKDLDTTGLITCQLLLQAGADPNARDMYGRNSLFYYFNSPSIVKMLLSAGADPSIIDVKGQSIFATAVAMTWFYRIPQESVRLLLDYQKKPDVEALTQLSNGLAKCNMQYYKQYIQMLQSAGAGTVCM